LCYDDTVSRQSRSKMTESASATIVKLPLTSASSNFSQQFHYIHVSHMQSFRLSAPRKNADGSASPFVTECGETSGNPAQNGDFPRPPNSPISMHNVTCADTNPRLRAVSTLPPYTHFYITILQCMAVRRTLDVDHPSNRHCTTIAGIEITLTCIFLVVWQEINGGSF